jgi:hypothetical protein
VPGFFRFKTRHTGRREASRDLLKNRQKQQQLATFSREVGYFAPIEGSSDYTLVVGAGFPTDWPGKIRIGPDDGILGMAKSQRVRMQTGKPRYRRTISSTRVECR